jgi:hypothetical protein
MSKSRMERELEQARNDLLLWRVPQWAQAGDAGLVTQEECLLPYPDQNAESPTCKPGGRLRRGVLLPYPQWDGKS